LNKKKIILKTTAAINTYAFEVNSLCRQLEFDDCKIDENNAGINELLRKPSDKEFSDKFASLQSEIVDAISKAKEYAKATFDQLDLDKYLHTKVGVQCNLMEPQTLLALGTAAEICFGKKYEWINVDWPWALKMLRKTGKMPSEFLPYETLADSLLNQFQLRHVQEHGYCTFWTVNSHFLDAIFYLIRQGYR
jgi:hypothetical protein